MKNVPLRLQPEESNLFVGLRDPVTAHASVIVNGAPLDPCLDLVNHSPTGFSWGYRGSGPAQLAFAILHYEYGEEVARKYYQRFKDIAIATQGQDTWKMTSANVEWWMRMVVHME